MIAHDEKQSTIFPPSRGFHSPSCCSKWGEPPYIYFNLLRSSCQAFSTCAFCSGLCLHIGHRSGYKHAYPISTITHPIIVNSEKMNSTTGNRFHRDTLRLHSGHHPVFFRSRSVIRSLLRIKQGIFPVIIPFRHCEIFNGLSVITLFQFHPYSPSAILHRAINF